MNLDFQNCSDGASVGEETADVFQLGSANWNARDAEGVNVVVNVAGPNRSRQMAGVLSFPGLAFQKHWCFAGLRTYLRLSSVGRFGLHLFRRYVLPTLGYRLRLH
ncbi:hypothetical protein PIB30_048988 [Stylosanthes scabra]|uniref:Uncharacterized protein n=1 Tax=Stylosanthes scabra TaxID=79078 RepID=A0ABU6WF96_9FABA|nr:hypothetical protein [Stylosanthes scabra]